MRASAFFESIFLIHGFPSYSLDLPFAPFNKLEKLGKFVDINAYVSTKPTSSNPGAGPVQISHADDGFIDVGATQIKKSKPKTNTQTNAFKSQSQASAANKAGQKSKHPHRSNFSRTKFKDNAGVQAEWDPIGDANKVNFEKTTLGSVKVDDILTIGSIPEYDKTWDFKLAGKKQNPFNLPSKFSFGEGPRDDPVMNEIIKSERNTETTTVYTTDAILSALMTVKNANFPWDISVVKEGNQYFIEPSGQKINYIDIMTVNENTNGNQPEDEKVNKKRMFISKNNQIIYFGADTQRKKERKNEK